MAAPVLDSAPKIAPATTADSANITNTTTPAPVPAPAVESMPKRKTFNILVLPGDHAGPEVMVEALKVLGTIEAARPQIHFAARHEIVGGCSIDKHGVPITPEVLRFAKDEADAVLFGSVGGPEWGTAYPNPESGLLTLRRELDAFANVRPCKFYSRSLLGLSPLKEAIVEGTDFVILRENCGGAYFGVKDEYKKGKDTASDSWVYTRPEIERVARVAVALSRSMSEEQGGKPAVVWSADKANVLASGRLWRNVTTEIFEKEFPDIDMRHQLADSLSMLMVKSPRMFNGVVMTDNTFGDMLSDQAGGIVGTLGVLPSASLCGVPQTLSATDEHVRCNGIYEPVHGSAPDIAGKGLVNPVAQILSVAMMLRYSLNLSAEALAIEQAVEKVLDSKSIGGLEIRTADLGGKASTTEVGTAICSVLAEIFSSGDPSISAAKDPMISGTDAEAQTGLESSTM